VTYQSWKTNRFAVATIVSAGLFLLAPHERAHAATQNNIVCTIIEQIVGEKRLLKNIEGTTISTIVYVTVPAAQFTNIPSGITIFNPFAVQPTINAQQYIWYYVTNSGGHPIGGKRRELVLAPIGPNGMHTTVLYHPYGGAAHCSAYFFSK